MSALIRVCMDCYRPVHVVRWLIIVGAVCAKHGRIDYERTIRVPDDEVNFEQPK